MGTRLSPAFTSLMPRPMFVLYPDQCLARGEQRRSEAYADVYEIPSTKVYTMMSWLHEGPMEEHVAVGFWSGPGPPGKCLQTLSLQFSKSVDGCKLIVSARRPEASSAIYEPG